MSFYQNPFNDEFRGSVPLSDRQFNMTFTVKPNRNQSDYQLAYNKGPYDFSGGGILTINYAWDQSFRNWSAMTIDVTGSVPSATTTTEVITTLNANVGFAELFSAGFYTVKSGSYLNGTILITPNPIRQKKLIKVYISNTGAEQELGFNNNAGISELPVYFARHTITNRFNFPDSLNCLIALDPTTQIIDQNLIQQAGFTYTVGVTNSSTTVAVIDTTPFSVGDAVTIFDGTNTLNTTISSITPNVSLTVANTWTYPTENAQIVVIHADWQLFSGRSGIFNFQNITLDTQRRIIQIIEYPAGAGIGYLARKIQYVYALTGDSNPIQITEIPYVLTSGDLVTPP